MKVAQKRRNFRDEEGSAVPAPADDAPTAGDGSGLTLSSERGAIGDGRESARASGIRPATAEPSRIDDGGAAGWQSLCLCEIANFGSLRRYLGRSRAEGVAHEIAARVAALLPQARVSVVARAQVELLFACRAPEEALAEVERLRSVLAHPVDFDGERHAVEMNFGVAALPATGHDEVRLVEAAETALAQAREQSEVVLLDLSRVSLEFDRMMLMRDLSGAIDGEQMFLQYQPKVHVRRQEIASAEALIRWQHPERGLILPGDFISLAEECGKIRELTMWTLKRVIADQRRLDAAGHAFPLFINISGLLLADRRFVDEASELIVESRARIGFEITETSVIRDPELAIRNLKSLADVGVALAIDDYGAGLSSLAYLKQLPASELKIDKMFVMQLTSSNRDPLIVRSTIDLAHALEMEVTAEGVETPSALALLSVMGCDMVQGYLISRPLAFEAFRAFLDQDGHLASTTSAQSMFLRPEGFWRRA